MTDHFILLNRIDSIKSATQIINKKMAEIQSDLSRLPNPVADAIPNESLEWHERLRAAENFASIGKASWSSAEHHLINIMIRLEKALGE